MTEKLKAIIEEYGTIAIATYFVIFALVLLGFFFAILWGFEVGGVTGGLGVGGALGAAWVATKVTQPARILATLALTPILGMALRRFHKAPAPLAKEEEVDPRSSE